jgi:peptidoglycan/LPS O-acetylase OafA/YrhL
MNQHINTLEAGRGLAALAVVLLHAATMMSPAQYSGKVGFDGLFDVGRFGVDFFFVLSGFIIYYSNGGALGSGEGAIRFLVRRVLRIFPAYWAALVFGLLLNVFQRDRVPLSFDFLIKQFFLLDTPLWLGPAWTLQFELIFYLVFSVGIIRKSLLVVLILIWMGLIVFRSITTGGVGHDGFYQVISNPYCSLFFCGVGAAFLNRRVSKIHYLLILFLLGILISSLSLSGLTSANELLFRMGCGVMFSAVLLLMIKWESRGFGISRPLVYLGKISYSLYISHVIFVGLTYAVLVKVGIYHRVPEILNFVFAVLVSIGLAVFSYRFIERPAILVGKNFDRLKLRRLPDQ